MIPLCRFCLVRKQNLTPIFDKKEMILKKINDVVQLEISHDDGLPGSICQQCVFQLNSAHCFKQRCITAENKLKAFVSQMSGSSVESALDLFPSDPGLHDSDSEAEFDLPPCEVVYTEPNQTLMETKERLDTFDAFPIKQEKAVKVEEKSDEELESDLDNTELGGQEAEADEMPVTKKLTPAQLLAKKVAAQKKKDDKNLPVICEICGKLFKKNHLYYHRKLHSTERKYECTECNKSFKMVSHLKRHVRLHVGEKSYLCSFCGKSFIDSSNLRNHTRNHRQERNHKCVTCGKAFSRAETLIKHLRSHTGEKPYTCEICTRLFPRKDSLIRHMKSHRGERPHKCDICERSFTQSYDLKLHIKKHLARAIPYSHESKSPSN